MFLETRLGAFSIVQAQPPDDGDGAIYHVSSRARADLDRLLLFAGFLVATGGAPEPLVVAPPAPVRRASLTAVPRRDAMGE